MTSTLAVSTITIDLRRIAPRECHALNIARFDATQSGQALALVNDHEPQALHAQFEDLGFRPYAGRYVEAGPATWRVRIGKCGAIRRRMPTTPAPVEPVAVDRRVLCP